MSSKLVFHGGLFVVLPGRGDSHKVDVLMRTPESIAVIDQQNQNNLPHWERELSAASRIDFLSEEGSLVLDPSAIRRVSHAMPVNYSDFHKAIGCNSGTLQYRYDGAPPQHAIAAFNDAHETNDPDELLNCYKRLFPGTHQGHDDSLKKGIVQSFGSSASVQMWLSGFRIEVELPRDFEVLVNGRAAPQWPQDDLDIVFRVHPDSTIPHYPLNNPHVLEQPPTI